MEKLKPEIIVINDDEDNEPDYKPTRTKKKLLKKKKKRKVERTINTSSNTETLVITQKVKEQKFKCIINLTNVCEHREKKKRKNPKINAKKCAKVKRIVPDCLRKKCKIDVKRKFDNYFSRIREKEFHRKQLNKSYKSVKPKSFERKKLKYSSEKREDKHNISSKEKKGRVEPLHRSQNHTRYLSPISSDSLSDMISESEEDIMSYEDISSDSTTEIDTLIKRTKDRERNSSLNRSYEFNPWSSTSTRNNYISKDKVTEKHDKIKDSESFENAQLEVNKCRNKICAVQPVTHSPKYYCIEDIANIPLPNSDKPNHVNEYIIDMDGTYDPNFMSTPKNATESHDASASDGGTVLTGEMDIVSFHSQGTLVLDTFYSPSHPTGSPSFIYDVYSPIRSPTFFYHEDVIENTPTHCDSSHVMPSDIKHLITNSAGYTASQGLKSYSPSDCPIVTVQNTYNIRNLTDITLETNVKQEQFVKLKDVKVEHTSPKTDIGSATNVATYYDIRSVKVEGAEVSEKRTIETIFESPNINANVKKEVNEDSINNNISLKPDHNDDFFYENKQ